MNNPAEHARGQPPNDRMTLTSGRGQVGPFEPPAPVLKRSWWPRDVPPSQASTYRHVFFKCDNGQGYLAVVPNAGEAYYWRR